MSATGGIGSFADDLDARTGPVSGRVALSLRSAEGKPAFAEVSPGHAAARGRPARGGPPGAGKISGGETGRPGQAGSIRAESIRVLDKSIRVSRMDRSG